MSAVFTLDKAKIRQSFGAASQSYDGVAELQRTVGRWLIEQERSFGLRGTVLDLGSGTGYLTGELLKFQAVEHLLALDIALPMLQTARQKLACQVGVSYLCADAERLTLASASVDRIFSNLALQWCRDLSSVFNDCRRILKANGRLVFSTFGPNTLCELKQAWAAVDRYSHVNDFYAANELIAFLTNAGFTKVRQETQIHQPSYASVLELMRELKGIGAQNASTGRNRKLTTQTQLQRMISAYPVTHGRISATFEVITMSAGV